MTVADIVRTVEMEIKQNFTTLLVTRGIVEKIRCDQNKSSAVKAASLEGKGR